MKILFKIISVFLYFNFVSPVLMYYIYDDNPNIGFVALDNSIGNYVKTGFTGNGKRQFTGSYSSKYQKINNEHVVDSHFKIMKSPPKYKIPATIDAGKIRNHDASMNGAHRKVEDNIVTEPPVQWKQRTQNQQLVTPIKPGKQDPQNLQVSPNPAMKGDHGAAKPQEAAIHVQPAIQTSQQISPIRPKAVNADYSNQLNLRNQRNQDTIFEAKPSFFQMNLRKTQMADSQKIVRKNSNRQMTSLALRTQQAQQENRQRMPTSMMMDKTLHKTNGIHDHNTQVMTRILDDMTQNLADRRHKKGEYRKRNARHNQNFAFEKSKRSVVSDNMRKYIGKDKSKGNSYRSNNMELSRISSHEENAALEPKEIPYALFYRMNPETLDQQEGFMLLKSMEENSSNNFNNKDKRLTFDDDDFEVTQQQKPKMSGNTPKLRKKLKNFATYRKY